MAKYNIHAGHSPAAPGASGFVDENREARSVKNRILSMIRGNGHIVYDCTDDSRSSSRQNLYNIVANCNAHSVDADISIHLNAGGGTGCEVLITGNHTSMRVMAERICSRIASALGIPNRGIKIRRDLYVLNNTNSPALLVECCFVDSKNDAAKWNATKCADAIVSGIIGKDVSEPSDKKPTQKPGNAAYQENRINYRAHSQTVGILQVVRDGQTAGLVGYAKRLEGLYIDLRKLREQYPSAKLKAKAHIQGIGWKLYENVEHDTLIGTQGQGKRLEAIELDLIGVTGKTLLYRTHLAKDGWTGWVRGGFASGSVGIGKPIEAIQIKVE